MDVCLTQDMLRILGGTIETCNIVHVDFSQNMLKNGGAKEAAKIICRNKHMQHLDISNNQIREEGLAALLQALDRNKSLRTFVCEGQKF